MNTIYTEWLATLCYILEQIRREGITSIESEVDNPGGEGSIFRLFPRTLEPPYYEFALDLLRNAVRGNLNSEEMALYADYAIAGHADEGQADIHLLKTIWMTFLASLNGYDAITSIDFGRQAIPVRHKPSFKQLEAFVKEHRQRLVKPEQRKEATLDDEVDAFVASLE